LGDLAGQFRGALEGSLGGSVLEDLEELPVRVRYGGADRAALQRIGTLHVQSPALAEWIPANAFGELVLRPELAGITRRNGERVNQITAYLRPGTLPIEVTRAIDRRLADSGLELSPSYRLELAGDSAEQQRAVGQLLSFVPVLAVVMLASLVLSFGSFTLAALIGAVAILAVGLGMLSLWLGGYPLGFNPLIGSAGLVGVAINSGIVVLAAIRSNPRARAGDVAAIASETLGATRHIVSTTLTTVAGFVPLLVSTGGDFWPPLAIVIAGGVGLSIVLGLGFTPVVYRLLTQAARARRVRRRSAAHAGLAPVPDSA
jgi:multidrug efflux pump subunit AcrB